MNTKVTNISIMDKYYLAEIFGARQYPDGEYIIDHIDDILEFQKAFMKVVSKTRTEMLFTFPVITYSLLYQEGKFADKEFAKWCSDHNTEWCDGNFFVSKDVTSLSSCCFEGNTKVLVKILNEIKLEPIKNIVNNYKKNISIFHNSSWASAKPVKLPKKRMLKITTSNDKEVIVTEDHLFPIVNRDIEAKNLTTKDYITFNSKIIEIGEEISTLSDINTAINNTEYFKIKSIEEVEIDDDYVYCFSMDNPNEPYFTLPNGMITHNCRMINNFTGLDGFINSIGGTSLKIGSVKVNTINLLRIAYETNSEEEYIKKLIERTHLCILVLDIVRNIIRRNIEKGILPNYTNNLIELENQYNTIGINAMYETVEHFGYITEDEFGNKYYTEQGLKFASKIMDTINEVKNSYNLDYSINVESVPAERCAVILCEKDNILYPNDNDYFIYANQWIPLTEKCTLDEKIRVSSILDEKCGGGVILHVNGDGQISKDQAWKLLNYISSKGVIYFAFNNKISTCKNKHGFYGDICPTCGEPVIDTYQRIVGYLVPTSSYSKERKKEFSKRYWYNLNEN